MANQEPFDISGRQFPSFGTVIWLILAVVMAHVVYGAVVWCIFESHSDRGVLGDMFGSTNSVFSGIAMIGVVIAIFLQRKDLENQHREMQANNRAQREQVARMERAAEISAVSGLYDHYSRESDGIARRIAEGKQNWAVRRLQSLVESHDVFANVRLETTSEALSELRTELMSLQGCEFMVVAKELQNKGVARAVSSLELDKDVATEVRETLYTLISDFLKLHRMGANPDPTPQQRQQQDKWLSEFKTHATDATSKILKHG